MTTPVSKTSAPPLWEPWYGIPFGAAVKRFFSKYATFSGRAGRAEYWWVALFLFIVSFVLETILVATGGLQMNGQAPSTGMSGGAVFFTVVLAVWALAVLIPHLALIVRRLHDSNKAGWYILLGLIPLVGGIILLVYMLLPGTPEGARFDRKTA